MSSERARSARRTPTPRHPSEDPPPGAPQPQSRETLAAARESLIEVHGAIGEVNDAFYGYARDTLLEAHGTLGNVHDTLGDVQETLAVSARDTIVGARESLGNARASIMGFAPETQQESSSTLVTTLQTGSSEDGTLSQAHNTSGKAENTRSRETRDDTRDNVVQGPAPTTEHA